MVDQGRKTGRVVVLGVPDSCSDVPLTSSWANAFQNNCGPVKTILALFWKENHVSKASIKKPIREFTEGLVPVRSTVSYICV